MENLTVTGLRSRSRSKTPFLRSSCDREQCLEGEEHQHHKSGRKTPVKRNTPVKQLYPMSEKPVSEPIIELDEEFTSPPAHRTRNALRSEQLYKTSDYSSGESPERLSNNVEAMQNALNYKYEERVSTSTQRTYGTSFADNSLSPIQSSAHHTSYYHAGDNRSKYSPSHSACSTDSSFAEQALADVNKVIERDPSLDHLPYRLYKMAGEYWNKYPKTDYTYSPLSRDRVELAPGQVAVPNMSRRSLPHFRAHGPHSTQDELDHLLLQHNHAWTTSTKRKLSTQHAVESSDEEGVRGNGRAHVAVSQRWRLTQMLLAAWSAVSSAPGNAYRRLFTSEPEHQYRYSQPRQSPGVASKAGSLLAAPFVWFYQVVTTTVTTVVTTITETVNPSTTKSYAGYSADAYRARLAGSKRRVWPWALLLLVPLLGYACYNHPVLVSKEAVVEPSVPVYVAPNIQQDAELTKRLAALEGWALAVDSKLHHYDQKLTKLDNLEAQIESYSLKYLQQNLIQMFNFEHSDAVTAKFKLWLEKHYVSKDELQRISEEVHERLMSSWKPDLVEDEIRRLVQEQMSVLEKRQLEVLLLRVQEYVREVRVTRVESGFDAEAVRRLVAGMLDVYDADKTGVVDYALESAGGQVISTKCTELYQIKTKQYSILGLPVWWVYTSPRFALTPGAMPAECWAFQGFPGYLVVRTYAIVQVTGFSLEHMSRLLASDGKIESAPKNFSVYGLRDEMDADPHLFGDYMYDDSGPAIQKFPVQFPKTQEIGDKMYPVAFDVVELRVHSNHGNPTYTCVYRFRVHGNPLTDIRQATEDSMSGNA